MNAKTHNAAMFQMAANIQRRNERRSAMIIREPILPEYTIPTDYRFGPEIERKVSELCGVNGTLRACSPIIPIKNVDF